MQVFDPIFGPIPTTLSISELQGRCVQSFDGSISRPLIWNGFTMCHDRITGDRFYGWLWIGGDFVTSTPEPTSAMLLLRVPASVQTTSQQNATVDWLKGGEANDSLCDTYFLHEVDPSDPEYELYCQTEELIREEFSTQADGTRRGYAIINL